MEFKTEKSPSCGGEMKKLDNLLEDGRQLGAEKDAALLNENRSVPLEVANFLDLEDFIMIKRFAKLSESTPYWENILPVIGDQLQCFFVSGDEKENLVFCKVMVTEIMDPMNGAISIPELNNSLAIIPSQSFLEGDGEESLKFMGGIKSKLEDLPKTDATEISLKGRRKLTSRKVFILQDENCENITRPVENPFTKTTRLPKKMLQRAARRPNEAILLYY